jgi:AAA domain, putative AbiEii toxin, Type IV TA system
MRYTAFEVKDYKGIQSLSLSLDLSAEPRLYALVGLNETGKTTILEAIHLFRPTTELVAAPEIHGPLQPEPQDMIPVARRSNFNGEITISASVSLDDADFDALAEHLWELEGYRLLDLDRTIEIEDQYSFENSRYTDKRSLWAGPRGVGLRPPKRKATPFSHDTTRGLWVAATQFVRARLPEIRFFPNFLFEFPRRIYLAGRPGEPETDAYYRSLLQRMLDALGIGVSIEEHLLSRALSGDAVERENLESLLLDLSRDVSERVFASWEALSKRPRSGRRIEVRFRTDEDNAPYVDFVIVDADGIFGIHERSLGFRWFFVYHLLTVYTAREASASALFLFDEPASNLHPGAQMRLLKSLRDLSEQATVLYTTHSHHLIDPAFLASTYVVCNDGLPDNVLLGDQDDDYVASQTNIVVRRYRSFASQHPDRPHHFQPILDAVDYQPSHLELVSGMVMCEGKNDYYLLRFLKSSIGDVPPLALLPGAGAGSLEPVMRLYLGWARPFVVMLDSDVAGRREKERYRERFGALVEDRIFGIGDLCDGWRAGSSENLLTPDERLAIQAAAGLSRTAYRKKTFARAVEILVMQEQHVPLSEVTVARVRELLAGLRSRLDEAGAT